MKRLTVNGLCLAVWGVTALFALSLPLIDMLPGNFDVSIDLFRLLNSMALAMAAALMVAYSSPLWDMWRHRSRAISGPQLLTYGVVLNWLGLSVRMARWYIWGEVPAAGAQLWFYDVGLWISLIAGVFLISAVDLVGVGDFKQSKRLAALIGTGLALGLVWLEFSLIRSTPLSLISP